MEDAVFRLDEVSKVYSGRTIVQVESLEIRKGEIFALVGPSGAGKSTLLRLLNFLEPPTAGTIQFYGELIGAGQVAGLSIRRRVTTVFQRPVLLNRSVQANVLYGLKLRGRAPTNGRIRETLGIVGLETLARQPARTLSGGEAQRVALARAILIEPEVLLLDEPTANLDPYNVSLIEDIVRRLNQEHGTTIILVTHNVFQARRLAHRVGLMLGGRLIEVADTETFFDAPADGRTKAFTSGELVY